MSHIFEEEFRLQNPQWDFDNKILGPYTRWLEQQLFDARTKLDINERSALLKVEKIAKFVQDMRCDVADLKIMASESRQIWELHKQIHADTYLASIQGYIQKVKEEEE